MKIKKGKEEIIYLLNQAILKFQNETGKEIVQNTNRRNYEELAIVLSEISNQLPFTADKFGHTPYEADTNNAHLGYPSRKYDITGGQIKDALMGLVANPRPFLVDTCYIYVYGVGRQAFEKNPLDEHLIGDPESNLPKDSYSILKENQHLKITIANLRNERKGRIDRRFRLIRNILIPLCFILGCLCLYLVLSKKNIEDKWGQIRKDFNIMPYKITQPEIDSLEGVWICYIGSPQARLSDPNRYHKVVTNLIEIKYKDGYFTYQRYGASFNHTGYVQFEAPGLVSIHSKVQNNSDKIESPRHSLMKLEPGKRFLNAISASWSFDVGSKNRIIGIREVYQKLGKGGSIEEIINTLENASCQCKIIRWKKSPGSIQTFYLKNISLDSLPDSAMRHMIDETSILTKDPDETFILKKKEE